MTKLLCSILLFAGLFKACRHKTPPPVPLKPVFNEPLAVKPDTGRIWVLIKTSYGDMKAQLFNETPLHRDNFVKLAEQNYFDSLLFHRVIKDFMIQGGDPDSRGAAAGKMLGEGGPSYTIAAEIMPQTHFHKKGVLAAAREGDDVNPLKASSGSQFYIVQGKIQDEESLNKNERRINRSLITQITDSLLKLESNKLLNEQLQKYKKPGYADSLLLVQKQVEQLVNPVYLKHPARYTFNQEQRQVYMRIGGTPHLDNHYTVFGEIYEGMEVLEKIAASQTDQNNRPLSDVKMSIRIIRKPR